MKIEKISLTDSFPHSTDFRFVAISNVDFFDDRFQKLILTFQNINDDPIWLKKL
jgi:hypothetical protein